MQRGGMDTRHVAFLLLWVLMLASGATHFLDRHPQRLPYFPTTSETDMKVVPEYEPLIDASEAEGHFFDMRKENAFVKEHPGVVDEYDTEGMDSIAPLRFLMRDAATDLVHATPSEYLRLDGPNLVAATHFSIVMGETSLSHEQHAAEALTWAHLCAVDWRAGRHTRVENIDLLERATYLMIAERLRVLLDQQKTPTPERIRLLQEARLRERGEHRELRQRAADQKLALMRGRVTKATMKAQRRERVLELAKLFPDLSGDLLVYKIWEEWDKHWKDEKRPSARTIYRYLGD